MADVENPFAKYKAITIAPSGQENPFAKYKEPTIVEQGQNLVKAAGSGVVHGFVPSVAGIPGDLEELANNMSKGAKAAPAATPKGPITLPERPRVMPTSDEVRKGITNYIPEYEPKNFGERAAKTAGSFLPNMVLAPELWAMRAAPAAASAAVRYGARPLGSLVKDVIMPGVASQAAEEGVKNYYPNNPTAQGAAAFAAALLSPGLTKKIMTPYAAKSPEWLEMANLLERNGVGPIQYGQKAGTGEAFGKSSRFLGDPRGQQLANFMREPMRLAGSDAPQPTANAMQMLDRDLHNEITRLTSQYNMPYSMAAQTAVQNAVADYQRGTLRPNREVQRLADDILAHANANTGPNHGFLTGDQYQNFRAQLGRMASGANGQEAQAFRAMQSALDDAMSARMRGFAPPEDHRAFEDYRRMYQNYLTIADAKAAANGADVITPDQLASSIRRVQGDNPIVHGNTPLARHAIAGKNVLGLDPVAAKEGAHTGPLVAAITGGDSLSHLIAGHGGDPVTTAAVLAAGYGAGKTYDALPNLAGRAAAKFPAINAYLGNQVMTAKPNMVQHPELANMIELLNKRNRENPTPVVPTTP